MRILGIDPGLAVTGYGILDLQGEKLNLVNAGSFETAPGPISLRLKTIFEKMLVLIRNEQPQEAALEEGFYGKNVKVALSLGQSRGAVLLACCMENVSVHEYSPREVKLSVVGRGSASKEQVSYMVRTLLGVREQAKLDVTDALAVAYCHYQRRNRKF